METEKWRDQAVNHALYELQTGGDVKRMLEYGEANKKLTSAFAVISSQITAFQDTAKGKYRTLFTNLVPYMEKQMLSIDGYSRDQAIKMKGEGLREESQKKGGLIGLFSGGNSK